MSTNLLAGPVGRGAHNPRVVCGVTLVLVFLAGAATGALAMNLGFHQRLHSHVAFDTPAGKAAYFARMQKDLDLSPAQAEQMQSILNDFWQYYRTVLSDGKSRIMQVLDPPQRKKFERMLQER